MYNVFTFFKYLFLLNEVLKFYICACRISLYCTSGSSCMLKNELFLYLVALAKSLVNASIKIILDRDWQPFSSHLFACLPTHSEFSHRIFQQRTGYTSVHYTSIFLRARTIDENYVIHTFRLTKTWKKTGICKFRLPFQKLKSF